MSNIPPITFIAVNTTSAGGKEIVDAVSGKTPRLHGLHVATSSTGSIRIASGSSLGSTDTVLIGAAVPIAGVGQLNMPYRATVEGALPGTVSKNLQISSTAAITLAGYAWVSSSTY